MTIADIADRVKQLREARHWSQAELARRAGLSAPTVNKLEKRKRQGKGRESLEEIAHAFGLTVDQLLYGEIQDGLVSEPRVDIATFRHVVGAVIESFDTEQIQEMMQVAAELLKRKTTSEGE